MGSIHTTTREVIYDDKDDKVKCEKGGFPAPGDAVQGRLHWQCFLDGRVGLALLRSPGLPHFFTGNFLYNIFDLFYPKILLNLQEVEFEIFSKTLTTISF